MMEVIIPMDIGTTVTGQPQSVVDNDMFHESYTSSDVTLIDQSAVNYFKLLIRKYKKQMGDQENTNVCSGGLQQYLIRQKDQEQKYASTGQQQSKFENLPVSLSFSCTDGSINIIVYFFLFIYLDINRWPLLMYLLGFPTGICSSISFIYHFSYYMYI